jgi:hypothetical protein
VRVARFPFAFAAGWDIHNAGEESEPALFALSVYERMAGRHQYEDEHVLGRFVSRLDRRVDAKVVPDVRLVHIPFSE